MELLETILHLFVNYAMLLFEYIGVAVITFAGIQGLVNYVRRVPDTRLILAKGLAMGLEFKLGSEILRTVIVRNLSEIAIVGGIIVLRATLTILIHWEIKNEEKDEAEKLEKLQTQAARTQHVPESVPAAATQLQGSPEIKHVPNPQAQDSPETAQDSAAQTQDDPKAAQSSTAHTQDDPEAAQGSTAQTQGDPETVQGSAN